MIATMNAKHLLALACAAFCGAAMTGAMASEPGSSPTNPLNAEQALQADALEVAAG